jgi:hypothetical protein
MLFTNDNLIDSDDDREDLAKLENLVESDTSGSGKGRAQGEEQILSKEMDAGKFLSSSRHGGERGSLSDVARALVSSDPRQAGTLRDVTVPVEQEEDPASAGRLGLRSGKRGKASPEIGAPSGKAKGGRGQAKGKRKVKGTKEDKAAKAPLKTEKSENQKKEAFRE